MLGVALWVGIAICVELAALRNIKFRELFDGQTIILIKKGKIIYSALKKERLNVDDLTMMLRTNNVFSVSDVDYAILEPNGDLSILEKKENAKYLPTVVILEGRVIAKNLKELNLTEDWLDNALNNLNIKSKAAVLYAEIQKDGQLHIQPY